jgi:hypothetical protein
LTKHNSIKPDPQTCPAAIGIDILSPQQSKQNDLYTKKLQALIVPGKTSIHPDNNGLEHKANNVTDKVVHGRAPGFIQKKCKHCEEEREQPKALPSFIQKKQVESAYPAGNAIADQIESTRGKGSVLPDTIKTFMESRFGIDFSNVRIHSDEYASRLSDEFNAQAFTTGNDIYFNRAKFFPESSAGKHLLAHELTHTIQQKPADKYNISSVATAGNQQRQPNSIPVASYSLPEIKGRAGRPMVQKAGDKTKDEQAKKIIEAGKDASKPIDQRAVDAVNSILKAYYDPNLVDSVIYDEKTAGLVTSPVGKGKDIKGKITVGKYFIDHIDIFARRVLQVGHELQHVQQQRSGMGGGARRNEREFLAFYWETTEPEKAGTGRMSHSDHVLLIDEALRNYYCMPADDQKAYAAKKDDLQKLRVTEEKASGHDHTEPPTSCT